MFLQARNFINEFSIKLLHSNIFFLKQSFIVCFQKAYENLKGCWQWPSLWYWEKLPTTEKTQLMSSSFGSADDPLRNYASQHLVVFDWRHFCRRTSCVFGVAAVWQLLRLQSNELCKNPLPLLICSIFWLQCKSLNDSRSWSDFQNIIPTNTYDRSYK